ncbi:MAG: nitrogenase component 1 [Oscillospiraceae bacterium]
MLTPVMKRTDIKMGVPIASARFPSPFTSGLEYAAPARGTWNIVHIGMLIPHAHEIFVCAAGCLRGVVLTAAEMGATDRFSTVSVRENNVLDGDMERLIIDGVSDILRKLPTLPPAVLVYTSCIHQFMGCDLQLVYRELRQLFPNVAFTDCYMTPTMRKSGLTPDQTMRKQLYSLLERQPLRRECINIIGNNAPTDESSELVELIRKSGHQLRDITLCKTYDEYLKLGESGTNISYLPAACAGGEALARRLGQKHLYLPLCYGYEEIANNLSALSAYLGIDDIDVAQGQASADAALASAQKIIGDTPIAIDYTAVPRPLGLARLLLAHGFHVTRVYADSFISEEQTDFVWLQKNWPRLELLPTLQVQMRVLPRTGEEKLLAIGQKAAYFCGTGYFVNIVEGGGMYGFDGICKLAEMMIDGFLQKKDTKSLIQIKGLGCGCCV